VVGAVRAGRFHVWAVSGIDEGIELLTGRPAGERAADGTFPEGTVHRLVQDRLREYADRVREFGNGAHRAPPQTGASSGPASLTMSSADSSPGVYFGRSAAGKIASSEMPPTIRNDARSARIWLSSLSETACAT